jgi:hypothetical protein
LKVIGGMSAGWVGASWPLARLIVSESRLEVWAPIIGTYGFTAADIVAIEPCGWGPIAGVRIIHNRPDYPKEVVFGVPFGQSRLMSRIRESGFRPSGMALQSPQAGMPVQPWALIAAFILWNLPLIPEWRRDWHNDPPAPTIAIPSLLMALLGSCALMWLPGVQGIILKPGRTVSEMLPALRLVCLTSAFLLVVMTLVAMARAG